MHVFAVHHSAGTGSIPVTPLQSTEFSRRTVARERGTREARAGHSSAGRHGRLFRERIMKVFVAEQLSIEVDLDTRRIVIAIIDVNGTRHEAPLKPNDALETASAICNGFDILFCAHTEAGHA